MASRWPSLRLSAAASRSPPLRGWVERWRTAADTHFAADEAAVDTVDALAAGLYVGTPYMVGYRGAVTFDTLRVST